MRARIVHPGALVAPAPASGHRRLARAAGRLWIALGSVLHACNMISDKSPTFLGGLRPCPPARRERLTVRFGYRAQAVTWSAHAFQEGRCARTISEMSRRRQEAGPCNRRRAPTSGACSGGQRSSALKKKKKSATKQVEQTDQLHAHLQRDLHQFSRVPHRPHKPRHQ